MATIIFDDKLDARIAADQRLPDAYRGGRKTRLRAEWVAREWLREMDGNGHAEPGNGNPVAAEPAGEKHENV